MDNASAERLDVPCSLSLRQDATGLSLTDGTMSLQVNFAPLLKRTHSHRLSNELIVRATHIKGCVHPVIVDATAGFGQDAFLLAAAGAEMVLFEKNPVVYALLSDALSRAKQDGKNPALKDIVSRMRAYNQDSIAALANMKRQSDLHEQASAEHKTHPDVIYLDPMFPARSKSAIAKKRLQLLERLEAPCANAKELLHAALSVSPHKVVVKRPLKGEALAGKQPSYSLRGKTIRYDVYVPASYAL